MYLVFGLQPPFHGDVQHRVSFFYEFDVARPLAVGPSRQLLTMKIAVSDSADSLDDQLMHVGDRDRNFRCPLEVARKPARWYTNQCLGDPHFDDGRKEVFAEILSKCIPIRLRYFSVVPKNARTFHCVFCFTECASEVGGCFVWVIHLDVP